MVTHILTVGIYYKTYCIIINFKGVTISMSLLHVLYIHIISYVIKFSVLFIIKFKFDFLNIVILLFFV